MQALVHIIVKGKKILLLTRPKKYTVMLRIRKSGEDGNFWEAEGEHLENEPILLNKLKQGKVIEV